ncbi:hypothetical protein K493DRAFT_317229 [Basidiobolus meristosporus CBS 931.73]|uniref:HTH APSES-type domain-containing protein n=1 Tax=Basidiobolus meristosporus CBS 931.73 TaxID=1314790 RepID=A0A1Y1Y0I6_9FUNG|nr:hypothetical protein K493DRAFT_317229 [Basidiobolus meristosporus CBS 931.73]|eukprot:ORX91479.1 hypothetical protein K493DRAFT_317229 [Basidiobolus meristosporus CBS 931.73]
MPELALQGLAHSSELGQLPHINKSPSGFRGNFGHEDALFTAILKALVLLKNRPSCSREIADCIVKYKLATLCETSICIAVSGCLSKYFNGDQECYSVTMPLLKIQVHETPDGSRYSLRRASHPPLSTKRSSLVADAPRKKLKACSREERISSLPLDDLLSDDAQSFTMEGFDECPDTFGFDTIVPISYEASSRDKASKGSSEMYDSDASNDDHSDLEFESLVESIDSEGGIDKLFVAEDMVRLDIEATSPSAYKHGNELYVPLCDHDFHSDSSHSSTESGTSTTSPLLTPESSPRRDSSMLESIFTSQSSTYEDSFADPWDTLSSHSMTASHPDRGESKPSTLLSDDIVIPELDKLVGICVDDISKSDTTVTQCVKKPRDNTTSDVAKCNSTFSKVKLQERVSSEETDGNVVPCIEDQVSSFLYLDEEDEKVYSNLTLDERKESLARLTAEKLFQPQATINPPKAGARVPKSKGRAAHSSEYNPNTLIPSMFHLSPQIFITMVESLPFYVITVGPAEGFSNTYRLLRRYDSGYVNATTLLTAGGMESEKEQAIVLSLEIRRMRIRRQESPLFGTWIPLQRARALAATCSLQQKLGPFLDYDLPSYFPAQLPPHIAVFNPDQVSTRLHKFIRTRAASLKPRDNYVANIGIAPRCLHPTSKSFFSGVGHQLNQILGLQSKQLKSHTALDDSANPRRSAKSKPNRSQSEDYRVEENIEDLSLADVSNINAFIEDIDYDINKQDVEGTFLDSIL